jgi:hypothetical protein
MGRRLEALREAVRVSRAARSDRPVFIVGEPRSGTSILYRCLQLHPSFTTKQMNLVESWAISALPDWDRLTEDQRTALHGFMWYDPDEWDAVSDLQAALALPRRAATRLPARVRASRAVWVATGQRMVFRCYIARAAVARGASRLVEKSPRTCAWVDHLVSAFPAARMLYIHRHPIDTFSSYARRAEKDQAFARVDIEAFVAEWRSRAMPMLRWAEQHPDRLRLVKYEDLVNEPEPTLRAVLAYLGEEWDPACLPEVDAERGARWTIDPALFGEIDASTKDWRDHVSLDDATMLEALGQDVMDALGHQRRTGAAGPIT